VRRQTSTQQHQEAYCFGSCCSMQTSTGLQCASDSLPWRAQGHSIPSKYLGSSNNPTIGASQAQLSGEIQELGVEFATDELHHVIFLRTALGSAAPDKPAVRRAPPSPA